MDGCVLYMCGWVRGSAVCVVEMGGWMDGCVPVMDMGA